MKKSIVTIGVFDGVHIGHRAVIGKVLKRAKVLKTMSIVVTFDPHPIKVLRSRHNVPSLISLKHRVNLIKELGVNKVVVMPFDKKMARMPPEKFIEDILIDRIKSGEIFVGEDFRFGNRASAGVAALKILGKKSGLRIKAVRHVKRNGRIVSSSLIRELVIKGMIKRASSLLGRPYSILGTVVSGSRLGHMLGYPTANINPHHEVIPPSGVYAVRVKYRGRTYKGIMNIGLRPTFYDHGRDKEPSIEVHIFDFNQRIYGMDLEIIFVRKLRGERKFNTIDSLIEQVKRDEKAAKRLLS